MLWIAVSYRRCGRNLRAKSYTAINSLSANDACLTTLYIPRYCKNTTNTRMELHKP